MGKGIRWVFTIIAAAFLTALIQPPLERMLENAGWYESPYHAAGKIVNWIEQIVGVQAFPWMAGVALGLAAGVWLDPLLKRLDGTHPLSKFVRGRPDEYQPIPLDAVSSMG